MRMLLRVSICTVFAVFLTSPAWAAPKTFADIGSDPGKAARKVWFGPDHADFGKIASIGYPQRVGLLSFYIVDTGTYEFSALNAVYGTPSFTDASGKSYVKVGESYGLSDRQANIFATEFAELAVPRMKALFGARGMTLLTPVEFLESDAQIEAYKSFRLPKSGFQTFTETGLKILDKNPHANGAADGFLMIPTHVFSGNRDSLRALDALRQKLGLDAFVVVLNTTATDKKSVAYTGTQMLFYGPNPVPLPDNKIQAKFWTAMIPYPSGTYGKGFKGIRIYNWKTKSFDSFDGYEGVIDAVVSRSLGRIDEEMPKQR